MSSSVQISTSEHRLAVLQHEGDPRPSSTSVVATLRHSPRLLLRKKASALKEPAQSPDIFARGPGPALRASTRLQTRNASAKVHNSRTKKASRQQQQQQQQGQSRSVNQLTQYTNDISGNGNGNGNENSLETVTTSTTRTTATTRLGIQLVSADITVDGPVQTRSSRSSSSSSSTVTTAITITEPMASTLSTPTSRINTASSQSSTSIVTENSSLTERKSRITTRSLSQTRETTRARTRTSRTRAHTRTLSTKASDIPGDEEEKSDEEDEEDEVRFRYHLRSPTHQRRRRSVQKPVSAGVVSEARSISNLSLTPRLTRLGARHESGHGFEEEPDQEQSQRNRHLEKAEKTPVHGRRSRSTTSSSSQDSAAVKNKTNTTTYSSPGAQAAPRKVKKKSVNHHKVPSLPANRRRLRARTTKIAKMGIDGEGVVGGEEEEEEDDDDDDEEEEEEEEEEEDVDYENYSKPAVGEDMMEVEPPTSVTLPRQQNAMEDIISQNTQGCFIASKPEVPATTAGFSSVLVAQTSNNAKRKVDDEYMEDLPMVSMDEDQIVSTKLARIDDTSSMDKHAYLKTFYSILKSPRGDDDDGILSSESEDADLESEDDEDDFEEIDIWEFIGTLPPLGPLPHGFISTMPDRTESTPAITLVLDIDETLVHCATRPLESPDIIFPVEYNNETWEVYGRIRPGMHEFLEKTSAKFEVITFTASQECYAEALLKIIDPEKKYIKHRYYRDSCIPVFGNYIKDLRILNRDLSKVVIIDNSPQAFGYQISNGVPIDSWYDDKSDRELSKVMSFLETLEGVEDVRPRIDEQYRLQERLSKALAQLASHQQISSMNGLGALGTTLDASFVASTPSLAAPVASTSTTVDVVEDLSALQEIVPDHANVNDTSMMIYEIEFEKPPSPSDEDENECDEKSTSRMRRGGPEVTNAGSSGIKGGSQGMTMTTRSSLDATRHLVSL